MQNLLYNKIQYSAIEFIFGEVIYFTNMKGDSYRLYYAQI
jgi:hypothetical protein